MAQLTAMGHPIPVICNKMQMIPETGRPMVKNISQGLLTDKYEREFIAHYLLFSLAVNLLWIYSSKWLFELFRRLILCPFSTTQYIISA